MKTTQSPTFFFVIIFLLMLSLSSFVYADEYSSLTQSNINIDNTGFDTKSVKQFKRQQLENALFGKSIDQFFHYDLGVNKSTGIQVRSSFRVKLRSDHTMLQYIVRF